MNARNVNGCTPLHIAVMIQNINLVKLLVKYGGDVNLKVLLPSLRNIMISDRKLPSTTVLKRTTTKSPASSLTTAPILPSETKEDSLLFTMPLDMDSNK